MFLKLVFNAAFAFAFYSNEVINKLEYFPNVSANSVSVAHMIAHEKITVMIAASVTDRKLLTRQSGVRIGMIADLMSLGFLTQKQIGIVPRLGTDDEEGRTDTLLLQVVENICRIQRTRSIIKG